MRPGICHCWLTNDTCTRTEAYGHDALSRLIGVDYEYSGGTPVFDDAWWYDPAGNRQPAANHSYNVYNAANMLLSSGTNSYTNDLATPSPAADAPTSGTARTGWCRRRSAARRQAFACIGAPFAPMPSVEGRPIVRCTQKATTNTMKGQNWHDIYTDDAGMLHVLPHFCVHRCAFCADAVCGKVTYRSVRCHPSRRTGSEASAAVEYTGDGCVM